MQNLFMLIHFNKNIHFTKLVKVSDRLREFNFRLLPSTSNNVFHVDVPDDRGNRLVFRMQRQDNNQWRITDDQLPQWLIECELKLNERICEEMNAISA